MKKIERACHEFIDAVYASNAKEEFHRVAERAAHALGFRWFAYIAGGDGDPAVITSYPKSWEDRYFEEQYQHVDPVLRRARAPGGPFLWDGRDRGAARSSKERRFFDDALTFKIRTGVTIPIAAGYGRFAAFTFAVDDRSPGLDRLAENAKELLQIMGVTYHAHVDAKITDTAVSDGAGALLTLRERQCLAWTSSGKTMQEIAMILGVTSRAVKFHLDNGRRKLGASTMPHAVALAIRHGFLP